MRKVFAALTGFILLMSFVAFPLLADENEVSALKSKIDQLNDKVASLEKHLNTMEGHITTPAGRETMVTPPIQGEQPGGLIHTLEDIHMGGYVAVQYNNNFSEHTANLAGNPLRSFDANQNTFSVNQTDLTFQKTPNAEGGAGFNVELLMGDDAAAIEAATTGTGAAAVGTAGAQRFSLLNAYAEFVAPLKFFEGSDVFGHTIDIKAGRFVTLAGAEVVRATDNWNISRSFLFGLGEPISHTGIRATYNMFKDKLTTYWGLNNGWDSVIDNNTWKTWELGVSGKPFDSVTATSSIYFGPETARQEGHHRFLWSNVLSWAATDKLSFNSAFDLGTERRVPGLQNVSFQNAQWWGIAGYARFMATNKWGVVYRIEYFRDIQTYRTGLAGYPNHTLWEQTFGTDYQIYDNLTGRLEFRFDKSQNGNPFRSNSSQSTLGAELIYKFA